MRFLINDGLSVLKGKRILKVRRPTGKWIRAGFMAAIDAMNPQQPQDIPARDGDGEKFGLEISAADRGVSGGAKLLTCFKGVFQRGVCSNVRNLAFMERLLFRTQPIVNRWL